MARLTPSSLTLSTATSATSATAKVPNSLGPSSLASAMPMARVPSRPTAVFTKLQPSARLARPNSGSPASASGWVIGPPRTARTRGCHGVEVVPGHRAANPLVAAARPVPCHPDHTGQRVTPDRQPTWSGRQDLSVDALLAQGRPLHAEPLRHHVPAAPPQDPAARP